MFYICNRNEIIRFFKIGGMSMDIDGLRAFTQMMDAYMNFGREYQCFLESAITQGKARLHRKLKKATKKFMRYYHKSSMVIMPQAQFVCFNNKGQLIVCHAKY